jgi:hypothetical protein
MAGSLNATVGWLNRHAHGRTPVSSELNRQLAERCYELRMITFPQKTLKIVPPPLAIAAVANAPPVLETLSPTVEYRCGSCGAVLMRVDENRAPLMIRCTSCEAFNSTGG